MRYTTFWKNSAEQKYTNEGTEAEKVSFAFHFLSGFAIFSFYFI